MSEYASKATRAMMVMLVFTMQAAGLIIGPLLAAALLSTKLSHDMIWRILLAFGAIPALAVFQMRRRLAETPRYLLAGGAHAEFREAAHSVLAQPNAQVVRQIEAQQRIDQAVHGMTHYGLTGAEAMAAIASILGLAVTIYLLPETKGLSLEELSELAISEGITAR